jgi:rhodanese-related sulfurtransferase
LDDASRTHGFTHLQMNDLEITPEEFAAQRKANLPFRLIDVREPFELSLAKIAGSEDIPMRAIPGSLGNLEADGRPLVVLCHHGVRSLQVVCWLREQGIEDCRSLAGGIERWSRDVDPEIPRY